MADIVERLRAHCTGYPCAQIAWPHRDLHDAIAEIEALRSVLGREQPSTGRRDYDRSLSNVKEGD